MSRAAWKVSRSSAVAAAMLQQEVNTLYERCRVMESFFEQCLLNIPIVSNEMMSTERQAKGFSLSMD